MLSQTIDVVDTLLQPETILLAGPMATVPAYIDGVLDNFRHDDSQECSSGDNLQANILVSNVSPEQAAIYLAFNEFLASRDIELSQLTDTD